MRKLIFVTVVGAVALSIGEARSDELHVVQTKLNKPAIDLKTGRGGAWVRLRNGETYRIRLDAGGLALTPGTLSPPVVPPAGALPDTQVTDGARNIRRAWLAAPTQRYGHGVLGDAIEAGEVAAQLAGGSMARLALGPDAVFEDRVPRLADLDSDGRDEILVVKSYLQSGAALVVVAERAGHLRIAAEADAIGLANRWLNPVGTGDFDGDGRQEAAVVITPHIGGTLQLYEWHGNRLVEDHSRFGFSNHAMGSRELGLAVVIDWNGDDTPDMIVPDEGRRRLIGLTFAGGRYSEMFRHDLGGELSTGLLATDVNGDGRNEVLYGLENGILVALVANRP